MSSANYCQVDNATIIMDNNPQSSMFFSLDILLTGWLVDILWPGTKFEESNDAPINIDCQQHNYVILRLVQFILTLSFAIVIWMLLSFWNPFALLFNAIISKRFCSNCNDNWDLSDEELEDRLNYWIPEPLVPECDPNHYALNPRIISSIYGKNIIVDGKECLNLATHNYLGFAEDQDCIQDAVDTMKVYGVGSCGPRGFFGTFDIHLKLEEEIARFMKTEEAILYSYGYSAISSAIPAYSKNKDIIFVDECVNFSIQQGLIASRSKIKFFKHNDVEHLERLLEEQQEFDLKNPKLAMKMARFLVVEGLYINTGDICPLAEIIELKRKYKVRLFIDDTCGFGVLGEHGRGIVEHTGVNMEDVDMIAASLEYSCASYGGFCTGTHFVIDHQRLCGWGYCFSASLPPLQAAFSYRALKKIEEQPNLMKRLRENCIMMHKLLMKYSNLIQVEGLDYSPIKHLRFAENIHDALKLRPFVHRALEKSCGIKQTENKNKRDYDTLRLEKVVNYAYQKGYALTVARYLERSEHKLPKPSIRLIISSVLTETEIENTMEMLVDAFGTVQKHFYEYEF